MGRAAAGVWAIRLRPGDRVTGFDVVNPDGDLLVVTAKGYGKRTPMDQYAAKGRYTQGILTIDHNRLDETGPIITGRVVDPDDQISLITTGGIIIRMRVSDVNQMGRATKASKWSTWTTVTPSPPAPASARRGQQGGRASAGTSGLIHPFYLAHAKKATRPVCDPHRSRRFFCVGKDREHSCRSFHCGTSEQSS